MKKILILIALSSVLFGCTYAQLPIDPKVLDKVDKVAVISTAENEICYSYIGVTVFNNYLRCYETDDYLVGDKITNLSVDIARRKSGLPVGLIHVDNSVKVLLDSADKFNGNIDAKKVFDILISEGVELGDYRYFIILRPDTWQFDETPHAIKGVGMWGRLKKPGRPFIIYNAALIDRASGELLALGSSAYRNPDESLPWKEPYSNYNSDEKSVLWEHYEGHLPESLERAISPLFYRSEEIPKE